MRLPSFVRAILSVSAAAAVVLPITLAAQGSIRGTVTTTDGRPAPGASVHIAGTSLGAIVDSSGTYRVNRVPQGRYTVRIVKLGFAPDSTSVLVTSGATAEYTVRLRESAQLLGNVVVTAQRLGETQASALERRSQAPNVVSVLAGDVIRALPNANAAEAAGRMPGVSTERDEGEGKFVEVRGTEPRLTNVTIDGAHVPGSERGSRVAKLDDVPSDLLAAIEVSKTLTADMDADAIGGSVNLVTKTPEGAPKGYLSGQYGAITLLNKNQYQGGFAYGGRFGTGQRLGILLGGSADRNNRTSNDLEPAWSVDKSGRAFPIEWSQRDYVYRRNRYGLGGDIDYRFADGSALALKGMYSRFEDFGTTYENDISTAQTGSTFGATGDSAGVGPLGFGTGAEVTRMSFNRTPVEQLYGGTLSGRTVIHGITSKLTVNASGTTSRLHGYQFSPFIYDGPNGQGLTVAYNASNTQTPTYSYANGAMTTAAQTPSNFFLTHYFTIDRVTTGRDLGTALDFTAPWHTAATGWNSTLTFGGKIRDEQKRYGSTGGFWFNKSDTPLSLAAVLGSFSDPHYYSNAGKGFSIGPVPNDPAARQYVNSHSSTFGTGTDTVRNTLGRLNGAERIYAAYVSNTVTSGPLETYLGLRMESTRASYIGHAVTKDTAGDASQIITVPGSQSYTDFFPSAQLKYTFAPRTDARLAVTRGIARPDYASLAPSLQGTLGGSLSNPANLTVGNPALRPQHAWNYDLLVEHFFPSVGVISGGVFYKQLTDFIFSQTFTYTGPVTAFTGQLGTRPENGGAGHLLGFEGEWTQRLVSLPGALAGLGFDLNFTHVDSRVLVDPASGRHAQLQRQAPNLANVAGTYDFGPFSSRIGWAYQGANIVSYGDGSATPAGDTYFYAHSQIDASIIYNFTRRVQLQLQGLNLNNAVFGFYTGSRQHDYAIQREYYGRTIYLGAKYNL